MPKKPLTKKEVTTLCNNLMLKYYVKGLRNQTKALKKFTKTTDMGIVDTTFKIRSHDALVKLDNEMSQVVKLLHTLTYNVLVQDYIIGRIDKPTLITKLKTMTQHDILATTEALEEIEKQKDRFETILKEKKP